MRRAWRSPSPLGPGPAAPRGRPRRADRGRARAVAVPALDLVVRGPHRDAARQARRPGRRAAGTWPQCTGWLHGGSRAEPATVWAGASGLDLEAVPLPTAESRDRGDQLDLLGFGQSEDDGSDRGHLAVAPRRPPAPGLLREAADPAAAGRPWPRWPLRCRSGSSSSWSTAYSEHLADPTRRTAFGDPRTTARSESAAALLCVELGQDGLPIDRTEAERLIGDIIGPRPVRRRRSARRATASRFRCAATCSGRPRRPPQPGPGPRPAAAGRHRRQRHPLVAARTVPRPASGRRAAARLAQGRADRDDLRLHLAGPRRRGGRPAPRQLAGQRRRGRPDDRPVRPAQPPGRAAQRGRGRARHGVRAGRPGADRATRARRRLRRSGPGGSDPR